MREFLLIMREIYVETTNKAHILFSVREDKSITVNMLTCLLLLLTWISNGDEGNYLIFIQVIAK